MRLYLKKITSFFKEFPNKWPSYREQLYQRVHRALTNRPTWKQFLVYSFWTGAIIGVAVLGLFASVYFGAFGRLPSKQDLAKIKIANASEIYAANGELLGKYYDENRTDATLAEIPSHMINSVVATEDARFFIHSGVDPRALLRVFFRTILMGDLDSGGGSTLSQQLIKNIFPRKRHGLLTIPVMKIKEMILATRIEKVYSKAEIMELYLNTVPFGEQDVFGIKVAAKRFFGKPLRDLTIEESAVLVCMLKANTAYNPVKNPNLSTKRRNVVLKRMAQAQLISQIELDSLEQIPLATNYVKEGKNQGLATYFRSHLQPEIEGILEDIKKSDGSDYSLVKDGLKIYTTLDARLQQYAEEAIQENMPKIQTNFYKDWKNRKSWISPAVLEKAKKSTDRYKSLKAQGLSEQEIDAIFDQPIPMDLFTWDTDTIKMWSPLDSLKHYLSTLHAGFIALEPSTGLVKAWVGGISHGYYQYDHVKAKRQVGSTFKPVVYAQALENAFSPCDFFENKREIYPEYEDWSPRNSDGKYGGYYSMPGALSKSVNTVTVQLILESGVDSVRALAQKLGIEGEIPEGPAISLGTMNASLEEMVQVYSTFANDGRKPQLHYLDRIEDANGRLIYERPRPNPMVFDSILSTESNAILVNMLETVVDSGTARKLRYRYQLKGDLAGKTGTTQDQSDGWFLGFTPDIAVGVWVGAELPSVHFRTLSRGQGASTALPIAGTFLQKTYQDRTYRSWQKNTFSPLVDTLSFLLDCPHYLDDIPLADELLDDYFDNPGFFEQLYREIGGDNFQIPIETKKRRNNESIEDYLERMRRYNERRKRRDQRRQKDLKDFWSKKLFGKSGERRN
ncbi:MAG: transglycosylase domain-containing protein [Bacteroidota bacterium]